MAPDALMVADAAAQPDVSEAEGAAPDGTVGEDDARMVHHAERHVQGGHRRDAGTGRDTREDGAQQREDSRALPTGGAVRSEGNAKDAGAVESSFGELVKARASAHSAQHGNHGDAANSAVPGRVETPEGAIRPHGVVPSAGVERPHGAMDSAEKWHMRMEELGKTVAGMVWRGEKNLQVTLMPEHLGRITLSCQATDAGLAVVLHAENREAQSLLARQEEAVRSLLAESGFKLTQFDVRDDGGEGRRQRADAQGESGGSPVFYGRPTGAVQAAAVKSDRVAGAGGFWGTA
jgi:flagellar hook-length control protein FliK